MFVETIIKLMVSLLPTAGDTRMHNFETHTEILIFYPPYSASSRDSLLSRLC